MNNLYLKRKEEGTIEVVLTNEANKHTKGLLFDSLAYRYIVAREGKRQSEIEEGKRYNVKDNWDRIVKYANDSYKRDLLKFLELLDEAIGEHD